MVLATPWHLYMVLHTYVRMKPYVASCTKRESSGGVKRNFMMAVTEYLIASLGKVHDKGCLLPVIDIHG